MRARGGVCVSFAVCEKHKHFHFIRHTREREGERENAMPFLKVAEIWLSLLNCLPSKQARVCSFSMANGKNRNRYIHRNEMSSMRLFLFLHKRFRRRWWWRRRRRRRHLNMRSIHVRVRAHSPKNNIHQANMCVCECMCGCVYETS